MTPELKALVGLKAKIMRCIGQSLNAPGQLAGPVVMNLFEAETILAAIADLEGLAKPTHCHVKTGGNYTKVGEGRIQTIAPLSDLDEVVIYRAEHDGSLWARRKTEFEDGRFTMLAAGEGK